MNVPRWARPYLVEVSWMGLFLKHPLLQTPVQHLICDLPLPPGFVGWERLREVIEEKRLAVEMAENTGRWLTAVFLHERHVRTSVAARYIFGRDIDVGTQGEIASAVWVDCENIPQVLDIWRRIRAKVPGHAWMRPEEVVALRRLPERLRVYRGVCADGGWSWTLSPRVARFFADRGINESTGEVRTKLVRKRDVFAYLDRRNEQEVLLR